MATLRLPRDTAISMALAFAPMSWPLEFECEISAIPLRRGPAPEASRVYEETPESQARRAAQARLMQLSPLTAPRPDGRPEKHERRLIRRIRGGRGDPMSSRCAHTYLFRAEAAAPRVAAAAPHAGTRSRDGRPRRPHRAPRPQPAGPPDRGHRWPRGCARQLGAGRAPAR